MGLDGLMIYILGDCVWLFEVSRVEYIIRLWPILTFVPFVLATSFCLQVDFIFASVENI
jgi:hypothetical protein